MYYYVSKSHSFTHETKSKSGVRNLTAFSHFSMHQNAHFPMRQRHFWNVAWFPILLQLRDEKRVMDCLKKGIKIASQCMDSGTKAQLYVELLNKYVYFYERGHTGIKIEVLQEIVDRIKEELPNLEAGSDEADQINKHFDNTVAHLALKKNSQDDEGGPSFAGLNL